MRGLAAPLRFLQSCQYRGQHFGQALIDIVIANPKNTIAGTAQNAFALHVVGHFLGSRMGCSVNLDDQFGARAQEVDNIVGDGSLAPKLVSIEASVAKHAP